MGPTPVPTIDPVVMEFVSAHLDVLRAPIGSKNEKAAVTARDRLARGLNATQRLSVGVIGRGIARLGGAR
jgi:hypothetical protein